MPASLRPSPVRVLIVDDSALVRMLLQEIVEQDPDLHLVGAAGDGEAGWRKVASLRPDVVTLDVEMPGKNGLWLLDRIMGEAPCSVIMVSHHTTENAEVTLQALSRGAVDFMPKPGLDVANRLPEMAAELISKIKTAAQIKPRLPRLGALPQSRQSPGRDPREPGEPATLEQGVIAIGASTGGTEAIREVLAGLPPTCPPVLVVQHIPPTFVSAFARRTQESTGLSVSEATNGQRLHKGHVVIATGNRHLVLGRRGQELVCRLLDSEPVNKHRPSVDVLFQSVAEVAGPCGVGVLLTGMGADGAAGLLDMRRAGAVTLAQDEETSVVWGMPGQAVRLGAATQVLPLQAMASRVMQVVSGWK